MTPSVATEQSEPRATRATHSKPHKPPFAAEWVVEETTVAEGSDGGLPQPQYRARFFVKGELVREGFGPSRAAAKEQVWLYFTTEGEGLCSDLKSMTEAIRMELRWSEARSLAVARALLHPYYDLLHKYVHLERRDKSGPGRPIVVDALTLRVFNLGLGWRMLTDTQASDALNALFCRAVDVAAPFMTWPQRNELTSMSQTRKMLQREIRKLPHLHWVRHRLWGSPWVQ